MNYRINNTQLSPNEMEIAMALQGATKKGLPESVILKKSAGHHHSSALKLNLDAMKRKGFISSSLKLLRGKKKPYYRISKFVSRISKTGLIQTRVPIED